MEKRYTDVDIELRAIISTKEPPNRRISVADCNWNENIAGDRVIMEKFLGVYVPLLDWLKLALERSKIQFVFWVCNRAYKLEPFTIKRWKVLYYSWVTSCFYWRIACQKARIKSAWLPSMSPRALVEPAIKCDSNYGAEEHVENAEEHVEGAEEHVYLCF